MNKVQRVADSIGAEAKFLVQDYHLMQFLIEAFDQFLIMNERSVKGDKLRNFFDSVQLQKRFSNVNQIKFEIIINVLLKYQSL